MKKFLLLVILVGCSDGIVITPELVEYCESKCIRNNKLQSLKVELLANGYLRVYTKCKDGMGSEFLWDKRYNQGVTNVQPHI